MILSLIDEKCVPAAISVAKGIVSAISKNVDVLKTMEQSHVDAYFDATLAIEVVAEKSVLEQLIVPVFVGLDFYQQWCLLVNLKKNSNSRIQRSSCTVPCISSS